MAPASALTVIPIRDVIATYGYEAAFLWFGLVQGGVVFILAWLLRAPEPGETAGRAAPQGDADRRAATRRWRC